MLEPETCRAARALLDWSRARLAKESGVSAPTIDRYERGQSSPLFETVRQLRRTLEKAGVVFIDDDAAGPGVRLKERKRRP
jgi:transcriptional regulator with XRE-family HTH domain